MGSANPTSEGIAYRLLSHARMVAVLVIPTLLATAYAPYSPCIRSAVGSHVASAHTAVLSLENGAFPVEGLSSLIPQSAMVKLKPAALAAWTAYCGLTRPVKGVVLAAAVVGVVLLNERRQALRLIQEGELCMLGDEYQCDKYDNDVVATPGWK